MDTTTTNTAWWWVGGAIVVALIIWAFVHYSNNNPGVPNTGTNTSSSTGMTSPSGYQSTILPNAKG